MVEFFRLLDTERHVVFCPMNFVADTYSGCPHACWYCYAPSTRRRGFKESFESFRHFERRLSDSDVERIESALEGGDVSRLCAKGQEKLVTKALQHRHPLRIGSVSEPFGLPLEKQYRHTYKILEKLTEQNYPYVVCTKSPFVATPEYINLMKSSKNAAVQISLISLDDNLLRYLESRPGGSTPSANSRLKAMKKLAGEGIFTICRIQPMIPEVTEMGMKQLIFTLAEAGVNHVIVEFLWFPMAHAKAMGAKLKEILDEYCRDGGNVGDNLRRYDNNLYEFYESFDDHEHACGRLFFSKKEIARLMPQFAKMVSEANKEYNSDMTFGSGNEETQYLNDTDNCCGVDRISGFSGYPKCAIQMMLKIAKQKGNVTLSEMKQFYNPNPEKFEKVWKKRYKGKYFIEDRVFKLRAEPVEDPSQVRYVYDDTAVP
jgi:DNA repair photolyase